MRHTQTNEFLGERLGAPVADFLNRGKTKAQLRIIGLLLELIELSQNIAEVRGAWDFRERQLTRIARVNQRLKPYRTSPTLWLSKERGSGLIPFWSFEEIPSSRSRAEFVECHAARKLLQLADMGLLASLQQCEDCARWVFVRFPKRPGFNFCSSKCRIHYNASTDEAKEYRRDNKRTNYWKNQLRDAAKAAARVRDRETKNYWMTEIKKIKQRVAAAEASARAHAAQRKGK